MTTDTDYESLLRDKLIAAALPALLSETRIDYETILEWHYDPVGLDNSPIATRMEEIVKASGLLADLIMKARE